MATICWYGVAAREAPPKAEASGIESADDERESLAAGVSLPQLHSGYFEAFSRQGHGVYRRLLSELQG